MIETSTYSIPRRHCVLHVGDDVARVAFFSLFISFVIYVTPIIFEYRYAHNSSCFHTIMQTHIHCIIMYGHIEHFVYLPKQATANPQDIPFFLSTKLDSSTSDDRTASSTKKSSSRKKKDTTVHDLLALGDPVKVFSKYEDQAARLAQEYEEEMVRF